MMIIRAFLGLLQFWSPELTRIENGNSQKNQVRNEKTLIYALTRKKEGNAFLCNAKSFLKYYHESLWVER